MAEQTWYIVKKANGQCDILPQASLEKATTSQASQELENAEEREVWGPFSSPQAAIAKRVGLIRAGKCQPT